MDQSISTQFKSELALSADYGDLIAKLKTKQLVRARVLGYHMETDEKTKSVIPLYHIRFTICGKKYTDYVPILTEDINNWLTPNRCFMLRIFPNNGKLKFTYKV